MPEIKNLKKAARRASRAINKGESIVLYSDADLDGTASLVILEEAVKSLAGRIAACYFPDRENEGYGLNEKALDRLKRYAPGLLIISDSGIANWHEVKTAQELGFEVIIIDHHELLAKLPPTPFIVNPKQKDDSYRFKFFAACGLCFKFAQALLGRKMSTAMRKSFLELAALGTIADMMPEREENKEFIREGLYSLQKSVRPGIAAFLKLFQGNSMSQRKFAQKIISVLQLSDFQGNLTESYLLLRCANQREAEELAALLVAKNKQRREDIEGLIKQILERPSSASSFVFEASREIPHLLTGNIASKICQKTKRATFITAVKDGLSRGSVRSPKQVNSVEALKSCHHLLETYGGHPQAAGFSVATENINKFKQCLENYLANGAA